MSEVEQASQEVPVPGRLTQPAGIMIISFGFRYGAPPEAHVLLDVRRFAVDLGPGLRDLTAEDVRVRDVLGRDYNVRQMSRHLEMLAFLYSAEGDAVIIAVGCDDGRQLSPVIAVEARILLGYEGEPVTVYDRDIHRGRPVAAEVI